MAWGKKIEKVPTTVGKQASACKCAAAWPPAGTLNRKTGKVEYRCCNCGGR